MRNTFITLATLLFLCAASCGHRTETPEPEPEPANPVLWIDTTASGLILYFPPTDSIELSCFDRPDPADTSIYFCCAAAFTVDWGTEPDHDRIRGDHVSRGQFYQRPRLERNTGAFRAWDNSWSFLYDAKADPETFRTLFKTTACDSGAAFMQEMMIHKGNKVKTTRPDDNYNLFRALCQTMDGRLCIADAVENMYFGDFIQLLLDAGAVEALYMDMGGCNYSWYREYAGGDVSFIHPDPNPSETNWLVFHHF